MDEQLFIFTASNPEAYQHYIDTIEEGFTLESIRNMVDEDTFQRLKAIYGDEKIRAWGATPGPMSKKNWERMQIEDRVLIYRKKSYEYFAIVTFKIHNKELAEHLWKTNDAGETWEYIYFLRDLTEVSVPSDEFNKVVGHSHNYIPQGFGAMSQDKLDSLKERFVSVDGFLKFLVDGEWVKESDDFAPEDKKEIIKEKISKSVGRTNLLEANLENFLAERVDQIEDGLKLLERQLDTKEVGRLDLLCEDKEGNLVVVELKKMKAGPSIIDQIQRYMGWIMEHKTKDGQKVRGIIIVGKKDTSLEYAVKANPLIDVKVFSISFS